MFSECVVGVVNECGVKIEGCEVCEFVCWFVEKIVE